MRSLSEVEDVAICDGCGAVTLTIGGGSFSMSRRTFRDLYGVTLHALRKYHPVRMFSCDWCVNHFGIDLCSCGSGRPFQKCHDDPRTCGKPSQSIDEGVSYPRGGWLQ